MVMRLACAAYILLNLIISSCSINPPRKDIVREDYATLAAYFNADQFYKALRNEVNEKLGVPVIQAIVDGLTFIKEPINTSLVLEIVGRLDAAFAKYTALLSETRQYVFSSSTQYNLILFRGTKCITECSRFSPGYLSYQEQFGTRVNLSTACLISVPQPIRLLYYSEKNLTAVLQSNALDSALRWQYIIDVSGPHVEYPAHVFPAHKRRHWAPFLAAALPFKRRIVILLDVGTLLSDTQLVKMKNIARIFLDCAVPGDRLMVMAATGKRVIKACAGKNFLDSTSDHLAVMTTFIDNLYRDTEKYYSHTAAIRAAFESFAEAEILERQHGTDDLYHNILFYVSRGIMSELSETASVLSAVAEVSLKANIRVKINTLVICDGEKTPLMWSTEFLRNIAEQNLTKHRQSFDLKLRNALDNANLTTIRGKMVIIGPNEYSTLVLTRLYGLFSMDDYPAPNENENEKLFWSYPFPEYQATLLSVSTAVRKDDVLKAVVGMDLNLDVIAGIIRYDDLVVMAPKKSKLRVFLCDFKGRTLIDSRMQKTSPWPLHIGTLEAWNPDDFWLTDHFADLDINEGSFEVIKTFENGSIKMKYSWKRLKMAPFIVVMAIRVMKADLEVSLLFKNAKLEYALDNLIYHRLDVQRDSRLPCCSLFGSLASMKLGGVYLSPSCFTTSLIQRPPTPQWIANYWVYLGDPFGLIRNTGIKFGIREHVGGLSGIIPYWRDSATAMTRQQILRYYMATPRGVMVTYPATVIRDNYEPDLQPWFARAVELPGRLVVTGPFLEDSVGQLVTISTAVYEGHSEEPHNPKEQQVFAVVAADVPVGFFSKLLRNTVQVCKDARRCVLFDDFGNVIARGTEGGYATKKNRSNSRIISGDAMERFHINYLEPQLATHLILKTGFVKKKQCTQWSSRSIERSFRFNISYKDVITIPCDDSNASPSSKAASVRAEIISVPQTNLFLALINESCVSTHPIQAFCPCSVSDRRCLLCTRFDDSECECPCQCPLGYNIKCSRYSDNTTFNKESLTHMDECSMTTPPVSFSAKPMQKTSLPDCFETRCESYGRLDDCLGVLGCQWCIFEGDGQTLLLTPFCAPVDQCFSGTKGRRIRGFLEGESQVAPLWSVGAPVGPVAAGIMSVFLIMVVAVYCYRSQVSRLVETNSLNGSYGAPLCDRTFEDDDFQFDHDGLGSSDEKMLSLIQLASFERNSNPPTIVRPQYQVSPRTESSDHGYSTMTDRMQGEESDRATSSLNISRQTEKTLLANDDCCASTVITEADIHQIPRALQLTAIS